MGYVHCWVPQTPSAGVQDLLQKALPWSEAALQAPDHVAVSMPLPRDAEFAGLRCPHVPAQSPQCPTTNLTPWPTSPALEMPSPGFASSLLPPSASPPAWWDFLSPPAPTYCSDRLSPSQGQCFPVSGTQEDQTQTSATGSALVPRLSLAHPLSS